MQSILHRLRNNTLILACRLSPRKRHIPRPFNRKTINQSHSNKTTKIILICRKDIDKVQMLFSPATHSVPYLRALNVEHSSTSLTIRKAFSGLLITIETNDKDLIMRINAAQLQPPMPSTSFPELDPGNYGSLQGDLDFWFYHLWLPFWNSLTPEKQAKLPIDKAWRSFIESHM